MTPPLERVKEYFKNLPFRLEVKLFDENTSTAPLAAQALGVEVGQIAKTLLFKPKANSEDNKKGVIVVTSGDVKVDTKKLKELVGFKTKFANGDEAQAITGYPPGGVCPFALPRDIPVYIDESMKRFPVVYAAGGTANSAVPITFEQLLSSTDGQACNVCSL